MVEGLYGELDEIRLREFEDHLGDCAACAALYGEMRATAQTMHRRSRPEPGTEFWDGYWQRLEARVARDETVVDASRFGWRRSFGSWGYRAAAAVVVLAAGVWIGRTVLQPAPRSADRAPGVADVTPRDDERTPAQEPARIPDETRGRGTELAAGPGAIDAPPGEVREETRDATAGGPAADVVAASHGGDDALRYIGRSQVVLLALLNGGNGGAVPASYSSEREQARVLVAEGRRLQDGLTRPEDRRLRELVGQLEMILREIANLEADNDLDAVEMIRNRVDREGVLLQIDLRQMREASAPGTDGNAGDQEY